MLLSSFLLLKHVVLPIVHWLEEEIVLLRVYTLYMYMYIHYTCTCIYMYVLNMGHACRNIGIGRYIVIIYTIRECGMYTCMYILYMYMYMYMYM